MKQIRQIGNTPLSISVYSVETAPTILHHNSILEIIFCLRGSVKFSYAYEEFTLHAGEYISVDKDAYYLYDGKDNLCVSLYFDLTRYEEKYYFIRDNLFVCEGCPESTMPFPTPSHNRLKGMMIALLKSLLAGADENKIAEGAEKIVDLFVNKFDILYYHSGRAEVDEETMNRIRIVNQYLREHQREKITIEDLAKQLNYTAGYMSEFMRKNSVGFRSMLAYHRANESEHLLLNTDKTILEISEECGFSDVKYYYSAFKKWYRCTPKQFREKYGKMSEENLKNLDISEISEVVDEMMTSHYMETFLGE